jgi:hypothetical protein
VILIFVLQKIEKYFLFYVPPSEGLRNLTFLLLQKLYCEAVDLDAGLGSFERVLV